MYSWVMLSFSPESIVSRIADKVQAEVTFFEDEAGSVLHGDTN